MSTLREAAQDALTAYETFRDVDDIDGLDDVINALRAALAQPESEAPRDEWRPASERPEDAMFSRGAVAPIVAGAIYDFAGFMTTRSVSVSVGASEACGPVVDLITSFAEKRGLDLEDAAVQSWHLCVGRDVQPPTEATIATEIAAARDEVKTWPKWMQDAARASAVAVPPTEGER